MQYAKIETVEEGFRNMEQLDAEIQFLSREADDLMEEITALVETFQGTPGQEHLSAVADRVDGPYFYVSAAGKHYLKNRREDRSNRRITVKNWRKFEGDASAVLEHNQGVWKKILPIDEEYSDVRRSQRTLIQQRSALARSRIQFLDRGVTSADLEGSLIDVINRRARVIGEVQKVRGTKSFRVVTTTRDTLVMAYQRSRTVFFAEAVAYLGHLREQGKSDFRKEWNNPTAKTFRFDQKTISYTVQMTPGQLVRAREEVEKQVATIERLFLEEWKKTEEARKWLADGGEEVTRISENNAARETSIWKWLGSCRTYELSDGLKDTFTEEQIKTLAKAMAVRAGKQLTDAEKELLAASPPAEEVERAQNMNTYVQRLWAKEAGEIPTGLPTSSY